MISKSAELSDEERRLLQHYDDIYKKSTQPNDYQLKILEDSKKAEQSATEKDLRATKLLEEANRHSNLSAQPITPDEIDRLSKIHGDSLYQRIRKKSLDRYEYDKKKASMSPEEFEKFWADKKK